MCRNAMQREREKVQVVVEKMAERRLRRASSDGGNERADKPS